MKLEKVPEFHDLPVNSRVPLATQRAKNGHLVYKIQGSRFSKKVKHYHNKILESPSIANIQIKVLFFKAILHVHS